MIASALLVLVPHCKLRQLRLLRGHPASGPRFLFLPPMMISALVFCWVLYFFSQKTNPVMDFFSFLSVFCYCKVTHFCSPRTPFPQGILWQACRRRARVRKVLRIASPLRGSGVKQALPRWMGQESMLGPSGAMIAAPYGHNLANQGDMCLCVYICIHIYIYILLYIIV